MSVEVRSIDYREVGRGKSGYNLEDSSVNEEKKKT